MVIHSVSSISVKYSKLYAREHYIARNIAILKKKKKKGLILLDMSREEWGRSYWLVYRTIFFFFCPIHIFPSSKMKRSNLNILVSILIKIDFFSSLKIGFFCFDYADVILNKSFSRGQCTNMSNMPCSPLIGYINTCKTPLVSQFGSKTNMT